MKAAHSTIYCILSIQKMLKMWYKITDIYTGTHTYNVTVKVGSTQQNMSVHIYVMWHNS
jgi:hypothetical protein